VVVGQHSCLTVLPVKIQHFFTVPAAGEIRGPPLGMMIEGLKHVLAPQKHFGVWCNFAAGR